MWRMILHIIYKLVCKVTVEKRRESFKIIFLAGFYWIFRNRGNEILLKREFADGIEELKISMLCILEFLGFTVKEPQINLLRLKFVNM